MEFTVSDGRLGMQGTGCIVAGVYEGPRLSPSAAYLDAQSGLAVDRVVRRGDFVGELGTTLLLHDLPDIGSERVLLVGLGPERQLRETAYRTAISSAIRALSTTGAEEATICIDELAVNGRDGAWKVEHAVLSIFDGTYRFDELKSKRPKARRALKKVVFHVANQQAASACDAAIHRANAIGEGIVLARDLGNMPGNLCTPAYLADQARQLGERHGFEVNILGQEEIEKLGMNGFLAVARGSRQPPQLIVMSYRGGAPEAPPVALVGKGITFDTGGICIKPALEMDEMKFDMCGAASVLGAMQAAALMKLPLNVVGIVPATENMPDGNAIKPGDVVTTMSGQTVEILDTDSEGRLVLCDALTFAEKYKPAVVVDIATLTSEIVAALGDVATGLFTNSDSLAREMIEAGESSWDRVWHMPLWDDYEDALGSSVADFPNVGPRPDCAATAACFLSRFTQRYPWVHLDIAGTAATGGADKGATGRPVALLAHFLCARAAQERAQ